MLHIYAQISGPIQWNTEHNKFLEQKSRTTERNCTENEEKKNKTEMTEMCLHTRNTHNASNSNIWLWNMVDLEVFLFTETAFAKNDIQHTMNSNIGIIGTLVDSGKSEMYPVLSACQ